MHRRALRRGRGHRATLLRVQLSPELIVDRLLLTKLDGQLPPLRHRLIPVKLVDVVDMATPVHIRLPSIELAATTSYRVRDQGFS